MKRLLLITLILTAKIASAQLPYPSYPQYMDINGQLHISTIPFSSLAVGTSPFYITINGVQQDISTNPVFTVASSSPVTSVFSRTGAITASSGDYSSYYYPLTGNPSAFLTGITSAQVTSALGFTPYNSTNPSGYITSSALSPYLTS